MKNSTNILLMNKKKEIIYDKLFESLLNIITQNDSIQLNVK